MTNLQLTVALRTAAVGGVWDSKSLLIAYQGNNKLFTGSTDNLPLPTQLSMILGGVKVSELVETVALSPLVSQCSHLLDYAIRAQEGIISQRGVAELTFRLMTNLGNTFNLVSDSQTGVRPSTATSSGSLIAFLGSEAGTPSLRASMMNTTVTFISRELVLNDLILNDLKDSAYVFGMMCVMAGITDVHSVNEGLKTMWDIENAPVLH